MVRRGRSASPVPQRRVSSVPARAPAPAPVPAHPPTAMAQPQQPGLMAQMATTAAGVAVGSAIGHTVGHALTSGFGGGGGSDVAHTEAPVTQQTPQQPLAQTQYGGPCSFEIRQFLECAQGQTDLTLCDGFNEAIRQCKQANGIM